MRQRIICARHTLRRERRSLRNAGAVTGHTTINDRQLWKVQTRIKPELTSSLTSSSNVALVKRPLPHSRTLGTALEGATSTPKSHVAVEQTPVGTNEC